MAKRKNMALEQISKEKSELQMTPMIDVTFLLLIFFMCTIKFKVLEGKLAAYLPKDVGVNPEPAPPREKIDVVLQVINEGTKVDPRDRSKPYSGTGRFVLSSDRRIQYQIGPVVLQTPEDVRRKLVELANGMPEGIDTPVTLEPKTGIVNIEVIGVLDAALAANFSEVTFKGAGGGAGK